MKGPADIGIRCSVATFRGDSILLVHRNWDDADDWVLPGGTPRPGESMTACARRETLEETGLRVDPSRIAFVLEALGDNRRSVDLVFLASCPPRGGSGLAEEGLDAMFVPLGALPGLRLRPPIAGYLRALHARGPARAAAYLGNLWPPDGGNGTSPVPETARTGSWESSGWQ